jgi:hypothetical protein
MGMPSWHGDKDWGLGSAPTTAAGSAVTVSTGGHSRAGVVELLEHE